MNIEEAKAAPEGLTDEELLELMPQQFRDDLATVSRLASYGTPVEPGIYRVSLNTGSLDFARAVEAAVLARHPTPHTPHPSPQPPADGEVEKLVAKLCRLAPQNPLGTADPTITRAAELLQRYASPACVVVSPSPEAIDALRAGDPLPTSSEATNAD